MVAKDVLALKASGKIIDGPNWALALWHHHRAAGQRKEAGDEEKGSTLAGSFAVGQEHQGGRRMRGNLTELSATLEHE